MSRAKTFRVSKNFEDKLSEIERYFKESGIYYTKEEVLDEIIDLYYANIFLEKNNTISYSVKKELQATLIQFSEMTAKFHNALADELNEINEKIDDLKKCNSPTT